MDPAVDQNMPVRPACPVRTVRRKKSPKPTRYMRTRIPVAPRPEDAAVAREPRRTRGCVRAGPCLGRPGRGGLLTLGLAFLAADRLGRMLLSLRLPFSNPRVQQSRNRFESASRPSRRLAPRRPARVRWRDNSFARAPRARLGPELLDHEPHSRRRPCVALRRILGDQQRDAVAHRKRSGIGSPKGLCTVCTSSTTMLTNSRPSCPVWNIGWNEGASIVRRLRIETREALHSSWQRREAPCRWYFSRRWSVRSDRRTPAPRPPAWPCLTFGQNSEFLGKRSDARRQRSRAAEMPASAHRARRRDRRDESPGRRSERPAGSRRR